MDMADDEISNRVANEIRAELGRQRKSQAELAGVLELSRAQVSERLLGRVPIRVDELERIAHFLGVPASQFLSERSAA